jgi:hypothetical protein
MIHSKKLRKKLIFIVEGQSKNLRQLVPAVSIYAGANFTMKNNPLPIQSRYFQDHADYSNHL